MVGERVVFTNWDTQDETGPESLPQYSHCHWSDLRSRVLSLLSTLCLVARALVGAIKAASELGKALPELQKGNSLVSYRPIFWRQLYSPRGHLICPVLLLHLLGETSQ